MDIDLKGFKLNCGESLMGDFAIHNRHRMTESETRMAVNWGIEHGCETASQIPKDVLDAICDPFNHEYEKYDDTPHFFTLDSLAAILHEIQGWHDTIDMTADELISEIIERLGDM